ncbi:MAG: hypothetical protein CMN55_16725 [Sneathiella sp.]|jgi:hypothetical protein|nr:hypothetical protein [Sneathiella sp.]|tara:strand:- start:313 stop:600 length:288 start_codon:yes stop_codon:yes gene_type:complete
MEKIANINAEISDVMNDISDYLEQTRQGLMVDMGSLPEKIVRLQGRVQSAPREDRLRLTVFMNQMMQALNLLSDEIQKQHDLISRNIQRVEGSAP